MDIFKKIITWGEERFITTQPHDKNGYVCNITSELREYIDAKNVYEQIDALCDIVVFSLTEMPKLGYTTDEIINVSPRNISSVSFTDDVVRVLGNIVDNNFSIGHYQQLISLCFTKIDELGFDIQESLEQTFLEIDSRKGAWNDDVKKWKKFTDEYHMSLWVKADYSKALL